MLLFNYVVHSCANVTLQYLCIRIITASLLVYVSIKRNSYYALICARKLVCTFLAWLYSENPINIPRHPAELVSRIATSMVMVKHVSGDENEGALLGWKMFADILRKYRDTIGQEM